MNNSGLIILIDIPLFLLISCTTFYFLRKIWRKKCTTPNRRRLFVAGWSVAVVGLICLLPPPKFSPLLEFDELETATGILQYHNESRGKSSNIYFTLEGNSNKYHFQLCDYPERVRNRLHGKEVTLWYFDGAVYQAATPEKIVYPLSHAEKQIFLANVTYMRNYLLYRIGYIIFCLSAMLYKILLGKSDENESEPDTFSLQDEKKYPETYSRHFLQIILILLCVAWLGIYAFLSDTYASHLRLAKLASYEHIVYPSYWAGSYKDMMGELEQAMQLASTEEERKEVALVWKRELYKMLSRFYDKELPNCYEGKAYSTGEKACAKLVQYIAASQEAYLLTNSEKRYPEDLGCFLSCQANYLCELGSWQKCEDLISQAISCAPYLPYGYAIRAHILWKQNRPAEALNDINKAIELDPKDAYSYDLRASIQKALGNKEAAKEDKKKWEELKAEKPNGEENA